VRNDIKTTLAKGMGCPVISSVTLPEIFNDCAMLLEQLTISNSKRNRILFFKAAKNNHPKQMLPNSIHY